MHTGERSSEMPAITGGVLGAGIYTAPTILGCLQDYLTSAFTMGQSGWPNTTVWNPQGDFGSSLAVLATPDHPTQDPGQSQNLSRPPSCPWTGFVVAKAGLLDLIQVDALCLTGSGACASLINTPGVPNAETGMNLSVISYVEASAGSGALAQPWTTATRPFPDQWWTPAMGQANCWCQLPGWIAVGGHDPSDPVLVILEPNVMADWTAVRLDSLFVLCAALTPGRQGAPTMWAPLAWQAEPYSLLHAPRAIELVWGDLLSQIGPAAEGLLQAALPGGSFSVTGPTYYPPGKWRRNAGL